MPAATDLCQRIQQSLIDIAKDNLRIASRTQVGMLDGLLSAPNRNGFEQLRIDPGNGKTKKVVVRYFQPYLDTDANDVKYDVCQAGNEKPPLEKTLECSSELSFDVMTFTKDEMRKYCESPGEWQAQIVSAAVDAFMVALNKRMITQFSAAAGAFFDGTVPPKQVPLINQSPGGLNSADFWGESLMMEDFADLPGSMSPILVGSGLLSQYTRLQQIGCCNQYGQRVDQYANFSFFRDRYVDGITGVANSIMAWKPGAFQLITALDNKGEFAETATPHDVETTVIDPLTGLELDLEVTYDRCNKVWKVQFGLCYDLFPTVVADAYPAGHELLNTNNGLEYQAIIS